MPVGLSRERYDHALFSRAEGARDKLLRVVCVAVLNLLWQSLLLAATGDIKDGKLALVAGSAPFAHRQVLLAFRQSDVSDCFRVVRAYSAHQTSQC